MDREHFDVCVIGGGPAGSTVAKKLAQFGYSVMLVEKEEFPRFNIGLSLTPGIHHWLQLLNVKEQIEAASFTRAYSSCILWESTRPIEKNYDASEAGYHVDRGHFDQILLSSAVNEGVQLFQPYNLKKLSRDDKGGWKILVEHQSVRHCFSVRFVVEAAGRKSILKGSKEAWLPQTLATYACWRTSAENRSFSFVEAGRNHWYWGAPVSNQGYLMCIFTDPVEIRKYYSVRDFYLSKVDESVQFSSLDLQCKVDDISVCSATAYRDLKVVSRNHIKVGDSAYSMDPLSAQGVQKAIKSAYQGAIVINTILSRPENSTYAIQYYDNMIRNEVMKNIRWTKSFYNRQKIFTGGRFWEARQDHSIRITTENSEGHISLNKTDRLFLNPEAKIEPTPVVGDSYIENAKGILLEGHEEPFVFLQNTALVPLITTMDKKPVQEGIALIRACIPQSDPVSVLRWLIYNRLLGTEKYPQCKK